MTSSDADELESLRARAYGPNSDIAEDPAAVRRLSQLEARTPPAPPPTVDEVASDADGPVAEPTPPAGHEEVLTRRVVAGRPRWLVPAIWSLSLLTAVVASVSISGAVIQRVEAGPLDSGATQLARLAVDSEFAIPVVLDYGSTVAFSDFHGMKVLVSPDGTMFPPSAEGSFDNDCIAVVGSASLAAMAADPPSDGSYSGPNYYNCGVNDFPAAVLITVSADMPEELTRAFPMGTALQFVFDKDDNNVIVYSSAGKP